jgi:phosphatidylserine decarboxylase
VVISLRKKIFRTCVIRQLRNPVWDGDLLLHMRSYDMAFGIQLTILDWDKLASNDCIGNARFDVKELSDGAMK